MNKFLKLLDKKVEKYEDPATYKIFYEDKFLERYRDKFIVCNLKGEEQSGGSYNDFTKKYNQADVHNKINKIEAATYFEYRKAFKKKFKKIPEQYIEKYVLTNNGYKLDNINIFMVTSLSETLNWEYPKVQINQLPKKAMDIIYVNFGIYIGTFKKNIDSIVDYIQTAFKFVQEGGDLIIRIHFAFFEEKFFNLIETVASSFQSATILYPKYFQKKDLISYIILKNKTKKSQKVQDYTEKIYEYVKAVNDNALEELKIHKMLIKIYNKDPDMFKIIFNKYNSSSYISFS